VKGIGPDGQLRLMTRAALLAAFGCSREPGGRTGAWLVIEAMDADLESVAALDSARTLPRESVVQAVRSGVRLSLRVDLPRGAGGLRVEIPGACPLEVPASDLEKGAALRRALIPRMRLLAPEPSRDVGYDAAFVVDAVLGCGARDDGVVQWRQVSGPPVVQPHVENAGLRFVAKTAPAALSDPIPWGILPVSAHASGEIEIEATFRPTRGAAVQHRVHLAAASRAPGLANVAVGHGVLLGGRGWSIEDAPSGARRELRETSALTGLVLDKEGSWILRDAHGRTLSLRAGRYEDVPLDCGRATCHADAAQAAAFSPMTASLVRLPDAVRPCALACHATGEPGTDDGGFGDVARNLRVVVGETGWGSLPRSLRRLGGVTCVVCHGPGSIPEPSGRWAILRTDVCATCHDAPPTYGHVDAWRSSRMARSDADPRTRATPVCVRCHTTSGFLAREGDKGSRSAPSDAGALGIACAACHAAHEHPDRHGAHLDALVREVSLPWSFEGVAINASSRICLPCHAPAERLSPSASAAAIWAGRGGVDPDTGTELVALSVHAGVERGCVGCHDAGPAGLERGASHGFAASSRSCPNCHADAVPDGGRDEIREQAALLFERLSALRPVTRAPPPSAPTDPRHALVPNLPDDRLGRATYDVLLVLEDPGAAAHNAPFARVLLAAGRKVLP